MKHCDAVATPSRDAHDGDETRSVRYIEYEYVVLYAHTW